MPKKIIKSLYRSLKSGEGNESLLLKGTSGGFIIKGLGAVVGFLLHIFLTRNMGADRYGIYMYVLSWINFVSVLGVMGFSTASTRYIAQYSTSRNWSHFHGFIKTSHRIVWVLSFISVISVLLISTYLIDNGEDSILLYTFYVGAISLPFLNLLNVHIAELRGIKKVVVALLPKVLLKNLIILMGAIVLLWMFNNMTFSAVNVMLLNLLAIILCFVFVKVVYEKSVNKVYKKYDPKYKVKEWLLTAKDMLLIAGFNLLLFQADKIMLGMITGTYEVGIYAVIVKIAELVVFILAAVNSALSPIITELHTLKKKKELQRIIYLAANITFAVSLLIVIGIISFDEFILNIFGTEFTGGIIALWILLLGQIFNSFAGPAVLLLNMTGLQDYSAKILGVCAFLNIGLNALLIPLFNVEGAAIATCTTMFVWNFASAYYVWKKLRIRSHPGYSNTT